MTLNILIADDHAIFRQGLAALLREQDGWQVVGEAGSGREAVALALTSQPQIVLLDIEMGDMDGIEAARRIAAVSPGSRIIALSMYDNAHYRQRMRAAAAVAYVCKSQPITELVAVIHAAFNSEVDVNPQTEREKTAETTSALLQLNALSAREREVLRLLALGQRMADIGTGLDISLKTVETYRARLQQKLEIDDLSGLVRFAVRSGLISPQD